MVGLRDRGIVLQVDPSPRLRLGTFNGRRPTRESLIGNGGGAPPVSRFLYRQHYRRIKSESQDRFRVCISCERTLLLAEKSSGG